MDPNKQDRDVPTSSRKSLPFFLRHSELGVYNRLAPGFQLFDHRVRRWRFEQLVPSRRYRLKYSDDPAMRPISSVVCMDLDRCEEQLLLCGTNHGRVTIYDLESRTKCIPTMRPKAIEGRFVCHRHPQILSGCQWLPGKPTTFVTAFRNDTVTFWDATTLEPVRDFTVRYPVYQIHCQPIPHSAPIVAAAESNFFVPFFDHRTDRVTREINWSLDVITSVRWSRECEFLLMTGGDSGTVALWDIRNCGEPLKLLSARGANRGAAHSSFVKWIRFSDDGLFVVTMGSRYEICVWNAHTMECWKTIMLTARADHLSVRGATLDFDLFSASGLLYAAVAFGQEVLGVTLITNIVNPQGAPPTDVVRVLEHFGDVNTCVFRPSRQQLITASTDQKFTIWTASMDETGMRELRAY